MAGKSIISTSILNDIGSAIIAKGGSERSMFPKDMPSKILAIPQTGTPEDYETVKANALKGATHADVVEGNPHGVTKNDIGLGNVDNTSDADKPVSTAMQDALDEKADDSSLSAVAKSGSYNDLENKPTIPAAQVNADWNASEGVSKILNKPTIPAAQVNADWEATEGVSMILHKPTIPAEQVNADWNATSGKAEILNKPTIPAAQIQSDWTESDTSSKAFIQNKPATFPPSSHTHTKSQIDDFPTEMTPTEHAASHATTGSDPITPADIGAETSGAASAAVSSHNQSTTAHSDIRGLIDEKQPTIAVSGILKGDGTGVVTAAEAGIDYLVQHQDISGKLDKTDIVAPSISATTGKAADAKATYDSLAAKVSSFTEIGSQKPTVTEGVADLTSLFETSNTKLAATIFATVPSNALSVKSGDPEVYELNPGSANPWANKADTISCGSGESKKVISVVNGVADVTELFSSSNTSLTGVIQDKIDATVGTINTALDAINGEVA